MGLEGMVTVLMHTPPTIERASTTTTRLPNLAAATAARWPAGPEPITTRSYCCALMPISLRGWMLLLGSLQGWIEALKLPRLSFQNNCTRRAHKGDENFLTTLRHGAEVSR